MRWSEKLYRLLLRGYPREYRARYAACMEQLFRDSLRESCTLASVAKLWVRTLADWAISVTLRHWERMTTRNIVHLGSAARRCVFFAHYEASSSEHDEITVEHLLLGILRQEPSLIPAGEREGVRRAVEAARSPQKARPKVGRVRRRNFSVNAETKRALSAAREIAGTDGRKRVSPRDLASAIVLQKGSLASKLLRELIADRDRSSS